MDSLRTLLIAGLMLFLSQKVYGKSNILFCYYDSNAVQRPEGGKVTPDELSPSYCTHLSYMFFGITKLGKISFLDYENDITQGTLKKFLALKKTHPKVKLIASIGGGEVSSERFSDVVCSNSLREQLIKNIVAFCKKHGFDGVNIQWDYPGMYGGRASDKYDFVLLLKRLREEFDKWNLILVITAGVRADIMAVSYDVPRITQCVHFVNLETCDYHLSNETKTAENSPLYLSKDDTDPTLSVNATITDWIQRGAPRSKLTLGIAAFGISFTLKDKTKTYIGAPTTGPGLAGSYINTPGRMMYIEICRRVLNRPTWNIRFSAVQKNPYAFKNYQWIGYENVRSVKIKSHFAKDQNLGGVSVFTVDYDDINNDCKEGKHPLLRAVHSVISK